MNNFNTAVNDNIKKVMVLVKEAKKQEQEKEPKKEPKKEKGKDKK
jgi:predicted RNase H-like HicB family nuclease